MIPHQSFTSLARFLFSLLLISSLLVVGLNLFSGAIIPGTLQSHATYQDLQDVVSMGGLLPPSHAPDDSSQCHSKTQHHLFLKASAFKPSSYLLSRLRRYESLHQRCAGEAAGSFEQVLNSSSGTTPDCRFVVWVSNSGLGNKLITLAATFLYALLTDRVLLVDRGKDMAELLCEPFPGASWLLPSDFPHAWLLTLGQSHPRRFGRMFDPHRCVSDASHLAVNATRIPRMLYIHLMHTYDEQDMRFFCEGEQKFLGQVPWLFLKSNNYFVPGLYFTPGFRTELERMFPEPETVFHHLGRYLFHPSNTVWDRAVRFYDSYLAEADRLVGLQLRPFNASSKALERYSEEVMECLLGSGLLPNVSYREVNPESLEPRRKSTTSVLVASLHQELYDKVRELYVKFPAEDGSRVSVHLPSHEELQRTDTAEHDKKALMEMFLLAFSERLVTSPKSTFGYVAQGLSGVKALVLRKLEDYGSKEPVCSTALSVEPCFHAAPLYVCECKGGRDPGKVLASVKHCGDVRWGIQLVN